MEFEVLVSKEAEEDIKSIFDFIAASDGIEQARVIEDRIMKSLLSLETMPARGKYPQEMISLGLTEYREVQVSPWRIFYYIVRNIVGVVAVLDGRRAVEELLVARLMQ